MKYISKFNEGRYTRKLKFEYLAPEDSEKIKEFVEKYLEELNILDKVKELSFKDFQNVDFNYKKLFENIIAPTHYGFENIYYAVDTFCRQQKFNYSTPALRNSLYDIIDKIYLKFNSTIKLKNKLDERLIQILEEDPAEYQEIFNLYGDDLNGIVKKKCSWMLDYKKYNL